MPRPISICLLLCTLCLSLLLLPFTACGSSTNTGATGIQATSGKPIHDAQTATQYLFVLRLLRYNMHTIGKDKVIYTQGRLTQVGDMKISYDDEGRITKLGKLAVTYDEGKITSVGSTKIEFDKDIPQRVARIGDEKVTYNSQNLANNVGASKISYDQKLRATKIGDVPITYTDSK
ncbi:hypothetical protein KSD_15470 [Ktedonobacter sp. SOSP1-85]|uniref:hypothetical protein n=1 Tax=Ktedonobacter sp. SOSP1-85 TaxID=2778367 RepID=UPI0019162661|nr:hypothetical protein [Ktedonobacter sp. SOSP1-85]GHO73776.1 hypothetical protein KSD_15470 [Ktedonobacter sp. SOSP1-85]